MLHVHILLVAPLGASHMAQAVSYTHLDVYKRQCRYPVAEGDVAIVGYGLPQYDYNASACESSTNTGQMGIVQEALTKLTIKRAHAVEADFVFTPIKF